MIDTVIAGTTKLTHLACSKIRFSVPRSIFYRCRGTHTISQRRGNGVSLNLSARISLYSAVLYGCLKDFYCPMHLADDVNIERAALEANFALGAVRSFSRKVSIPLMIPLVYKFTPMRVVLNASEKPDD